MIQLDWKSGIPAYEQIVNSIIRLKAAGALKAGDKLPSVRMLACKMGINPNTVQKAYLILESRGITYSVLGKGIFLAENEIADKQIKDEAVKRLNEAISYARLVGLTDDEINAAFKIIVKENSNDNSKESE